MIEVDGVADSRRVVLVTGASSGIGAAVAREAGRFGYHLVLTARRGDRLEQVAGEIRTGRPGANVLCVAAAIEDPGTPETLLSETLARFGRLDVVINNAGMGLPTLFADGDPADLRRQIEVNFLAPLMLARHVLPALAERKGMIINVGSAITALPNPALGAYGATKAGLAFWNDALRRELWDEGLRVCLVEPGPVKTEFFHALTGLAPRPGGYHPMLDAPASWMSSDVQEVARRIVRLIEHPKRRLSVRKRVVWPWRLTGALFRLWPWLGDLGVTSIFRWYEWKAARTSPKNRSRTDATAAHRD